MVDNTLTSHTTAPARAPVEVTVARWIWLVGSGVAAVSAVLAVVLVPDPLVLALVGGATAVELVVAVPAAVMVGRGAKWAWIVLIILAGLSLASLYQGIKLEAWGTVVFNFILGSTLGLLTTRNSREYISTQRHHASTDT